MVKTSQNLLVFL